MILFHNLQEAIQTYGSERFSEYLVVTRKDEPSGIVGFESQTYTDNAIGGELVEVMGKTTAGRARKLLPGQQIKVKARNSNTTWIITRSN